MGKKKRLGRPPKKKKAREAKKKKVKHPDIYIGIADKAMISILIRKARNDQNVSCTQLGKNIGVSQVQVTRLENAEQECRQELLEKVAESLGISFIVVYGYQRSAVAKLLHEFLEMRS